MAIATYLTLIQVDLITDVWEPFFGDEAVGREFGPVDIWVNDAMCSVFSPVKEMTPADFRRVTEVTFGAFREAVIAYFDWEQKEYQENPVREQVEVACRIGDVASDPHGAPKVHAHVVLGRRDGTALGGHLMKGHVRPTLELILTEEPEHLRRRHDPASGLALIRL